MVDEADIGRFLQAHFHPDAARVRPAGAGMFARVFAFDAENRSYVIRINAHRIDFQKDAFAERYFASPALPVPRILRMGPFDETHYYAISEACAGLNLDQMDKSAVRRLVPCLFDALDAIHCVDASGYDGWGLADANGRGLFTCWDDCILSLHNQKFDFDWNALMRETFLECAVYKAYLDEMRGLLRYCPTEKYLIHGDYGFKNVMSDGERITGVLDWAEFGWGDYLYDVAYLDFWSEDIPYGALWLEHAHAQGRAVPHFAERMKCYQLNTALGDMAIAAFHNDEVQYRWSRERVKRLWGVTTG